MSFSNKFGGNKDDYAAARNAARSALADQPLSHAERATRIEAVTQEILGNPEELAAARESHKKAKSSPAMTA